MGLDSRQPWRAAWRRPRQPAPPPMPTRPPPPTRLLRAPQRRGLVPKRHARRQAGRSCGSARYCAMQSDIPCVRARPAATANPLGAAQTRTRRPWPVAASRARPEACWAQGRRDSALQSVAAADALRRPQTLPAERAAADADGVPPCVGCGRPMDSLPLSFAHLARALHMGD
jgi:hypothetical protein